MNNQMQKYLLFFGGYNHFNWYLRINKKKCMGGLEFIGIKYI